MFEFFHRDFSVSIGIKGSRRARRRERNYNATCSKPESDPYIVQRVWMANVVVHHQDEFKQVNFSIMIDVHQSHQGKHLLLGGITPVTSEN